MTDENPEHPKTIPSFIKPWLDYRRKRFWALVAVLLYTLAGFFLVPVLVSHFTVKNIAESMDREATIAEVRFNPYLLTLEVSGFRLADSDDETLAAFDRLFVNFQLSSLFRWAWTFREVHLDGAFVLYEQFSAGDDRLSRLMADMERLSPPPDEPETQSELPRLLIAELMLNDGSARFIDHLPGETVDIPAGPVSVTIHELNTLPDQHGRQQVRIELESGNRLTWQGDIGLQPLRSTGELNIEIVNSNPFLPYLRAVLPIDDAGVTLSVRTDYALAQKDDGTIDTRLDGLEARAEGLSVTGLEPASEFLAFDTLELSGGTVRLPENTLAVEQIRLLGPFVDAWLDENGQPGMLQLLPGDTAPAADGPPATPWRVSVDSFMLEGGRLAFSDRSIQPPGALGIERLDGVMRGIDNQEGTRIPLSLDLNLEGGGSMEFEGGLVLLPGLSLEGKATTEGIPLALAQPWVQQDVAVAIESGTLSSSNDVTLTADAAVRASGKLSVAGLSMADTRAGEPLLAWERMAIDRYELDTAATSVRVSTLQFTKPYGRIHIAEDLSTNIGGLVRASEGEPPPESGGGAWTAVVGGIAVDDGSMDFSDFSLPLPFATHITGLDGTISTIDSGSSEPSRIGLEGQVDEFGLARIEGDMNLLDPVARTDVSVEFRNLLMTNLSPYSAQFAGRKIDAGKLDLDLYYKIDGGQLQGQNEVVLSDLVLGDEVDSPDAVSLPLGLAVALLKDANGVIDIELPVEGDINDPEFKIGGVIWKAFAGLITKVVSAPFKLLGSLIGVESEDFGAFHFLAGRADLAPPEREKVAQLMEALAQRPELGVEIAGAYVPAVDTPALQRTRLRATVVERLGRDPATGGNGNDLLDEEVRGVLEALMGERLPGQSLDELRAVHTAPPADDPEGKPVFDATAYSGDLLDRLVDAEPVGEAELAELANRRAQALADAFLQNEAMDPGRVRVTDPVETESEDGEWVVMELGVLTD